MCMEYERIKYMFLFESDDNLLIVCIYKSRLHFRFINALYVYMNSDDYIL